MRNFWNTFKNVSDHLSAFFQFAPVPLKVDHPNNIKRGGVCKYFKKSLLLNRRNVAKQADLSNMKEYLVNEFNFNNEKRFLTRFFRSPKSKS